MHIAAIGHLGFEHGDIAFDHVVLIRCHADDNGREVGKVSRGKKKRPGDFKPWPEIT